MKPRKKIKLSICLLRIHVSSLVFWHSTLNCHLWCRFRMNASSSCNCSTSILVAHWHFVESSQRWAPLPSYCRYANISKSCKIVKFGIHSQAYLLRGTESVFTVRCHGYKRADVICLSHDCWNTSIGSTTRASCKYSGFEIISVLTPSYPLWQKLLCQFRKISVNSVLSPHTHTPCPSVQKQRTFNDRPLKLWLQHAWAMRALLLYITKPVTGQRHPVPFWFSSFGSAILPRPVLYTVYRITP